MESRSAYVAALRAAREALSRTPLLDALAASERRSLRYLRSLFAIYDAEDLAALDLPWWSYRAIDRVEQFLFDRPDARVFEFGSGASTAWLARRAAEVHTVEHDLEFLGLVRALVRDFENVTLHGVPASPVTSRNGQAIRSSRAGHEGFDFSDYVGTIEHVAGLFDLIVVDGRARVACARRALPFLAPGGLLLVDDVERTRYAAVLELDGTAPLVLRGATPCVPFPTSTALLRATK